MRIYKLKFRSALHVDARGSGEPESAEEFVHSDTLSAALSIAWASVFPDRGREIFYHPPFKVGSAFPFIGDALLFPVPVWRIWKKETMDDLKRKEMKKVKWISESLFRRVLNGQEIEADETSLLSEGVVVSKSDFQAHPELKKSPFWKMTERQRVGVDRLVSKTIGPFFFALQFFGPCSGLWFPGEADDSQKLLGVLNYLGDTGMGADRNSGLGHFTAADKGEFPFQTDSDGEGWITLSLFNPAKSEKLETLTAETAYGLTTRSGWVSSSTVGRPPIRAFTEGSYFSGKPVGRMVETLPQEAKKRYALEDKISHTVPRDFRAVSLPCATPPYLKGGKR
jgi:CRISPR-associated protein Csm4